MSQAPPLQSETSSTIGSVLDRSVDPADENRILGQITRRLIPFLALLYVVNYLDRTNIAMAQLQMAADTGLTDAAYGFGAGLFFIGYFLFEFPSNLIMERVGARIWLARIMISWGIISTMMMFVRGPMSFYGLRFLLGLAEAGFFPGIVLYLTYWIPSRRRAGAMAAFVTSTAISGMVGNPMAGLLMRMNGIGGMHGWQWLFLLEGILPVALGFVLLKVLPDRPRDAKWLADRDREWLERELAKDGQSTHHHASDLKQALTNSHLWLLSVNYFLFIMGFFGFIYWLPRIIKDVSGVSDVQVGFLSAIPYVVATVGMVIIGHHADRHNERRWHCAICMLVAAVGMAIVPFCQSAPTTLFWFCIAAVGIWGTIAPFWTLCTRYLCGSSAAGGIAIINSIGCLAGFVAPYIIGWVKTTTDSFVGGLLVVAGSLVFGAILVLCVPRSVDRGGDCAEAV